MALEKQAASLTFGDPTPRGTQGTLAFFDSACPKFGMRRRSGTEPHGAFVGHSDTGCTESPEAMRLDAAAPWGVHTPGARFRLRCFQPISAMCRLASPGRSADHKNQRHGTRVPLVLPRAAVVKPNHHKCEAIAKDRRREANRAHREF